MSLRSIAAFEAFKGLLVILVGFGLLALVHRDLQAFGEQILQHMHLNPARATPMVFMKLLTELENINLRWLAIGTLLYSVLRFVEAYGLWFEKVWAEWLALFSTFIYLPWEFYDLWKEVTGVRLTITGVNLLIFLYLLFLRISEHSK